jgi:hypothetical protein
LEAFAAVSFSLEHHPTQSVFECSSDSQSLGYAVFALGSCLEALGPSAPLDYVHVILHLQAMLLHADTALQIAILYVSFFFFLTIRKLLLLFICSRFVGRYFTRSQLRQIRAAVDFFSGVQLLDPHKPGVWLRLLNARSRLFIGSPNRPIRKKSRSFLLLSFLGDRTPGYSNHFFPRMSQSALVWIRSGTRNWNVLESAWRLLVDLFSNAFQNELDSIKLSHSVAIAFDLLMLSPGHLIDSVLLDELSFVINYCSFFIGF